VHAGARQHKACTVVGLSARTLERWRQANVDDDRRVGPHRRPINALSDAERARVLEIVNSPRYRNEAPSQIVPDLADRGIYIASESTIYRILRNAKQLTHRGRAATPTHHAPDEHKATGPNQVWSWDITYLKTSVRGRFFYLYMVVDVWSRRIMGFEVHEYESPQLASGLIESTCRTNEVDPEGVVLHSDNGGPMKGSTMLATLQRLGIIPSFSRPSVSDDNPFSEALFRTLKYRPEYPHQPFETIEQARAWVAAFVAWYNGIHRHSGIRFVTPDERHFGRDAAVLEARRQLYARARRRHPERWSAEARDWTPIAEVYLNPHRAMTQDSSQLAA
jgi:putative transposase